MKIKIQDIDEKSNPKGGFSVRIGASRRFYQEVYPKQSILQSILSDSQPFSSMVGIRCSFWGDVSPYQHVAGVRREFGVTIISMNFQDADKKGSPRGPRDLPSRYILRVSQKSDVSKLPLKYGCHPSLSNIHNVP